MPIYNLLSKLIIAVMILTGCNAQQENDKSPGDAPLPEGYFRELETHRIRQNEIFNSADSPLSDSLKQHFTGIQYYKADTNYRVIATFEAIENGPVFRIAASGSIADDYQTVGRLHFTVLGKEETLEVYENQRLKSSGHELYFIPFFDLTNKNETYGGGRYLDLPKITGRKIALDFNYAYQPYCAYNHEYSCPIPPTANVLDVEIRAGERR